MGQTAIKVILIVQGIRMTLSQPLEDDVMKKKILVTREVFDEVLDFLKRHFEVTANQQDKVLGAEEP